MLGRSAHHLEEVMKDYLVGARSSSAVKLFSCRSSRAMVCRMRMRFDCTTLLKQAGHFEWRWYKDCEVSTYLASTA
eukprot:4572672-Amphidinium_carterae.1